MTKAPLSDIKNKLRQMYPGYRFEIKHCAKSNTYMTHVYKGAKNLGHINHIATDSMDHYWDSFKSWMKIVMTKNSR
jgi:hypothetical protein